jgi:hypothetical protein
LAFCKEGVFGEKFKYIHIFLLMNNQTESQTEKLKNIKCADIWHAPSDLMLSGGLYTALYRAARFIGREYGNYVKVCRDYDTNVVVIEGRYDLESYLKDCITACLRSQTKTLVKANCAHPEPFDMCKEVCRQVVDSHARLILTTNYRIVTYELTWDNVEFDAFLDENSFTIKTEN